MSKTKHGVEFVITRVRVATVLSHCVFNSQVVRTGSAAIYTFHLITKKKNNLNSYLQDKVDVVFGLGRLLYSKPHQNQKKMCTCQSSYQMAKLQHVHARQLFHTWYNREKGNNDTHAMFKHHPDIVKGLAEGKRVKILLYSKLRKSTRQKQLAWKRYTNHARFNSFCRPFYIQTHVSPVFARRMILGYLGSF